MCSSNKVAHKNTTFDNARILNKNRPKIFMDWLHYNICYCWFLRSNLPTKRAFTTCLGWPIMFITRIPAWCSLSTTLNIRTINNQMNITIALSIAVLACICGVVGRFHNIWLSYNKHTSRGGTPTADTKSFAPDSTITSINSGSCPSVGSLNNTQKMFTLIVRKWSKRIDLTNLWRNMYVGLEKCGNLS